MDILSIMDVVVQFLTDHLIKIYFIVGSIALFFFILRMDQWFQTRVHQRTTHPTSFEDDSNQEEDHVHSIDAFEESIESLKKEIKEQTEEVTEDRALDVEEDKKS